MPVTLRGGHTAADPRLGRVPQPDERNRNYPIRAALAPGATVVRRTWTLRGARRLDQGQTSSCVGHGWAHRANAAPRQRNLKEPDALALYRLAQDNDEWTGSSYDGTSVLGGAKAARIRGLITVYRWATTLDEVLLAISNEGPVVAGTSWYDGMFDPDAKGFIRPTGKVAGGHCYLLRGVHPDREYVRVTNSWGQGWGRNGDALLSFADLHRLLEEDDSEFCVPTET